MTMVAPLLLISSVVRYEAVLHSCETSLVGRVIVSGSLVGVMVSMGSGRVIDVSNAYFIKAANLI